jgi:hypothetical protein
VSQPAPPRAEPLPEPRVQITLHPLPAGEAWQAEVVVEGRQLHFPSLLALIGWLARLEAKSGGIR